ARIPALVLFVAFCASIVTKLRSSARNPKLALFGTVAILLGCGFAYGALEAVCWVYLKRVPVAGDPFVLTP
ncbi:MAG: hypothetical protein ACOYMN_11985, partial [Roseimicrobium sp.]